MIKVIIFFSIQSRHLLNIGLVKCRLTTNRESSESTGFCANAEHFGLTDIRNIIGCFEYTKGTRTKRIFQFSVDLAICLNKPIIILTLYHARPVQEYVHD